MEITAIDAVLRLALCLHRAVASRQTEHQGEST
jgi:hypothetical protein